MLALNTLIRPDHVPPWLQSELKAILTTLPLRPDGVRTTMEFVFAVHPSGTVKTSEAATPQKRGANITHESLSIASNLLSTPPKRITAQTWFAATSPQLFKLLDGHDGPELAKVASYVVGFGILGRKDFGAPGMLDLHTSLKLRTELRHRRSWMEILGGADALPTGSVVI